MKGKSIAIVGSGSIGLYYGGKLAADGHAVRFLLRAGYEEARREGIRIYDKENGDVTLREPQVFRTTEEIGPSDLVLVAVKATANASLPHLLPPLLHENTMVLTLQNGLGTEEFLAGHVGPERLLGGLCFICLTRRTPASVDHVGRGMLSLGEYERQPLSRTRQVVEAFSQAGVKTCLVENLAGERWRKLVWNIPFNGLAVATGGLTTDKILADPALQTKCRALMAEVIAVANALGHRIEPGYADFQVERTLPMGPYKPSTLVDWMAGQDLEIEPIWGEPLRRAHAAGVDVPHLEELYTKIKSAAKFAGIGSAGGIPGSLAGMTMAP
ncbi:MAG: 2-dehydropantoate 2-reductase [Verrucomicrobiota bacterium]